MKVHVFRLFPGQDIKTELKKFAQTKHLSAGIILTAVGCVTKATMRMAGATPDHQEVKTFDEDMEVVSLVGTLSLNDTHIHISCSRKDGATFGGHIKEGCIVGTTMEIAIGELLDWEFSTELDKATGFEELKPIPKN